MCVCVCVHLGIYGSVHLRSTCAHPLVFASSDLYLDVVGKQVYIKNCGFLTPTKNFKSKELRKHKKVQKKNNFRQFQFEDDPALPIPMSPA